MPIALPEPPQAVVALTQAKLQDIAQRREFRIAPLANAAPAQISLGSGHPVYSLGLSDVIAGKAPEQVPLSAYRFIVGGSGAEPAAAETLPGTGTAAAQFASVNSGPFVAGTVNAFSTVLKDPAFAQGDWDMRLLRVPALFVFAVWAHEKAGGNDRLRPIEPAPSSLDPAKTYSWADFLGALRPAAQQVLAADDGLKG